MTTTDRDDEADLDALLAAARSLRPVPGPDLMARVLADASAVAAARERAAPARDRPAPARWLRSAGRALGGWIAAGSLVAASLAGLGLGLASPEALSGLTTPLWGEAVSVTSGLDDDPLSLLGG